MKRFLLCLFILLAAAILGGLWICKQAAPKSLNAPVPATEPVNTPRPLELRKVTIESPYWTGAPLRIGLLANVNVGGPLSQPQQLDRIVGRLNVEQPDIILLAGDYVHGAAPQTARSKASNDRINWGHAILGDLNAEQGVFAVLGDHDHQYGKDAVRANLEAQGVSFIDNNAAVVNGRLCIFGIADETLGNPNDNGYYNCPANFPILGLMHNPESFSRVPSGTALMTAASSVTAKKAIGDTPAFVTSGIGSDPSVAPEIVLIELRVQR